MATLISRRNATALCASAAAQITVSDYPAWAQAIEKPLLKRPIPHSGEMLPVVGLGTSGVFDVGADPNKRASCTNVVRALVDQGGSIIDTAPSYGAAEGVVGDILAATGLRPKIFVASKLERYGRGANVAELRASLQNLKIGKIDLTQAHDVSDPNLDLGLLREWKAQGLCRYIGVTRTYEGDYDVVKSILKREKPDFVEIGYAIDDRKAEDGVLPAAAEVGAAVLVAVPFGRGRLFRKALGKKLPDWVAEFDCSSWAQFFLKFILGNPVITAAIPATDKPEHMIDNLAGGSGRLPDAKERARMVTYVESL
jgi:aryl-alcohol dehydrogenase-like predicted oxidoreductase